MKGIICVLAAGIDELKPKQQRDPATVLRVLKEAGRFSVFEATANRTIAKTISDLQRGGYYRPTGGDFPWTTIELTEKGKALLAEST